MYCNGLCKHLNEKKKKCEKHNKKLGYMSYKGKGLAFKSYSKCDECIKLNSEEVRESFRR